jgi:hypothetical protein
MPIQLGSETLHGRDQSRDLGVDVRTIKWAVVKYSVMMRIGLIWLCVVRCSVHRNDLSLKGEGCFECAWYYLSPKKVSATWSSRVLR